MKFEYEQRRGHGEIILTVEGRGNTYGGSRRHVEIIRVDDPTTQERLRSALNIAGGIRDALRG